MINFCYIFFSLKFTHLLLIFFSYFPTDLKLYLKLRYIFYILSKCFLVLLILLDRIVGFATFVIVSTCDNINLYHMLYEYILYFLLILDRFLHFLLGK